MPLKLNFDTPLFMYFFYFHLIFHIVNSVSVCLLCYGSFIGLPIITGRVDIGYV